MQWTEQRVTELLDLWERGFSARQIAERLGGITRNSVIGKLHRLGCSRPKDPKSTRKIIPRPIPPRLQKAYTEESDELMKRLHLAGEIAATIAHAVSRIEGRPISDRAIRWRLQRLGAYVSRRRGGSDARRRTGNKGPLAGRNHLRMKGDAAVGFADHKPTLAELQKHECRWPVGNPGEDDFHFCAAEQIDGMPYCSRHCTVAYRSYVDIEAVEARL